MAATPKQKAFITTLLAERDVPAEAAAQILVLIDLPAALPRVEISQAIDALMRRPKKAAARPAAAAPAAGVWDGIVVPSMYAIPRSELSLEALGVVAGADYLFIQVKTFKGTVYMRKLTGAPGGFSRSKLPLAVVSEARDIVRRSPVTYADHFNAVYTCCGSCGAELTDAASIARKLGPECRRKFGR